MKNPLTPKELGALFQKIESEPTGKLSELAKVAGLSLAEDYVGVDLSEDDLSEDDLSGADFSFSNLRNVNLKDTNLTNSNLREANLSGANLMRANLTGANLSDSDLSFSNLKNVNLKGANLTNTNLSGANLMGANLSGTNLSGANLTGANLMGANLTGANLSEANLLLVQAIETDFEEANLTGAFIEDGYINFYTSFENVKCDYIFMRKIGNKREKFIFKERPPFLGTNSLRTRQEMEISYLHKLHKSINKKELQIIPVLLPGASADNIPNDLKAIHFVTLENLEDDGEISRLLEI
ncbi:MAG: pentapeptide repeat-containing protein [Okeania sp. SIO3I5]|uniref:pentapeptide repeat-containing protein n=1 Tax=Okeania sp. SIO3I5 TaxID=2607805 RepID=UPI0013BD70B7|nr:pentapeptide repeat-containing protein [Okeania sp. SIO3I5]NEQ36758.1 pentapeptide repeat-containing protein [Okeania sp. SIO3I5]